MIVDAHHHLWDPRRASYPWLTDALTPINRAFTIADLVAVTTPAQVDATVLVQTRASTDETLEFLGCDQPVAGVIGWVDLTAVNVSDAIAQLRSGPHGHRLIGIRHQVHDELDPNWLDRVDVRRGISATIEADLAFDLLVRTRELPATTRLAAAFPEGRFVLDHLAKPPLTQARTSSDMLEWSTALRHLGAHANVSAKVSGLVTEADWESWNTESLRPAIDIALDVFGPQRLMFGSDWPVCLMASTYSHVIDTTQTLVAHLTLDERAQIFGENALRVYRLDLHHHTGDLNP